MFVSFVIYKDEMHAAEMKRIKCLDQQETIIRLVHYDEKSKCDMVN